MRNDSAVCASVCICCWPLLMGAWKLDHCEALSLLPAANRLVCKLSCEIDTDSPLYMPVSNLPCSSSFCTCRCQQLLLPGQRPTWSKSLIKRAQHHISGILGTWKCELGTSRTHTASQLIARYDTAAEVPLPALVLGGGALSSRHVLVCPTQLRGHTTLRLPTGTHMCCLAHLRPSVQVCLAATTAGSDVHHPLRLVAMALLLPRCCTGNACAMLAACRTFEAGLQS